MNKARQLLNLLESQDQESALDRFLSPSKEDKEQSAAIEKFRLKKQIKYMKKYQNDTSNDKPVMPGKDREYYWDANVTRISGG